MGTRFNQRRNSLRADALEHLCDEAHGLTLRASFISQQLSAISISIHVDESGHRISFCLQREVE